MMSRGQQNPNWTNAKPPTAIHLGNPSPNCPLLITQTNVTLDDKIRTAQQEQAIQASGSVALFVIDKGPAVSMTNQFMSKTHST